MNDEKSIEMPVYYPRCDFCMIAPDDSLKSFGINAGDIVELCQCNEAEVKNGDLVAVRVGGEIRLRRFYNWGTVIAFIPFGKPAEIFSTENTDTYRIEGKIIASRHILVHVSAAGKEP